MAAPPATEPKGLAIQVQGLSKSFGSHPVLRAIDLEVKKGETLAIFGPNGAGKTTLLKIISTVMSPTGGSVRVDGINLADDPCAVRRRIGVMTHQTLLYDDLTVLENLSFYGRMYDVRQLRQRIDDLVGQVGMKSRLHDRVRTLSRGMQQRVALARALLHDPPLLLLDEPETGLDQEALALLDGMVCGRIGRTVLITTHNLERGLQMGTCAIILVGGKIVHQEIGPGLDVTSFCASYRACTGGGL